MKIPITHTHEKLAGYLGTALLFPLLVSTLDQSAREDTDASYWMAYLIILIIVAGAYLYRQSLVEKRNQDLTE